MTSSYSALWKTGREESPPPPPRAFDFEKDRLSGAPRSFFPATKPLLHRCDLASLKKQRWDELPVTNASITGLLSLFAAV